MNIKLTFLGAAENVTGSRYLVESNGSKILVDCGLYQERHLRERNWDPFPLPPAEIDAVLLTHAHLDHCGYLPRLVRGGFRGKVHCTPATAEIARIVMMDSAKLQVEDARYKRKRHKRENRTGPRPIEPLYEIEDALACDSLFKTTGYDKPVDIADGIAAVFYDAGHILGASFIRFTIKQNGQERTILFSGDLGRWDKPILCDPQEPQRADYVLIESTYGDRTHPKSQDMTESLAKTINDTVKAGGNIVIPSFAVERAQEVLYHLNELSLEKRVPNIMTFLDSPMAIRVTEVFKNHPELFDEDMTELLENQESPFDFPHLMATRNAVDSKAINNIHGTALIIAGSGMCTGGRIKHHLVNNISKPQSTILFVGYQAIGTLGRSILEGAKEVRILGSKRVVSANIARLNGFSGHADRDELTRWIGGLKKSPRNVFVVHGEPESASSFRNFLAKKTDWNVSVAKYQQTVTLE